MANIHRGEISLLYRGQNCTLRPTFQALSQIEEKTQKGILLLAREMHDGIVTLQDIAVILAECMNAAEDNPPVNSQQIGQWLAEGNISYCIAPLVSLFSNILGVDEC